MRARLDHNATTPLRPEARARWLEVADAQRGNASSPHASGRAARSIVDDARERVAAAFGVREDELYFTSGGTESNNLALRGGLVGDGALVTTAAEHSSVLETARRLGRERPLVLLPVDRRGVPDLSATALCDLPRAALVSVMAANNETGTVPDLETVKAVFHRSGAAPIFHTDAVQALGKIPVDLSAWGVDLASFSAHKVGGPAGVGLLWRRRGTALAPILFGGGQEHGVRPGTEDVAGIAAAAVAVELAVRERASFAQRTSELVSFLWRELTSLAGEVELIGPALDDRRLPNTLCIRLPDTDGKVLVTRLDLDGVEASAGSACASGSIEPSHVLRAMGYDADAARSGLRLSLGRDTSLAECEHAARVLRKLASPSRAS